MKVKKFDYFNSFLLENDSIIKKNKSAASLNL